MMVARATGVERSGLLTENNQASTWAEKAMQASLLVRRPGVPKGTYDAKHKPSKFPFRILRLDNDSGLFLRG